ncbi:MAG: DUF1653 domain-containing protein [Candidatus Aenigmarchaeota archaeon]|nr:DUF1653 domain-containing protein [Candidatus Aenigmarchaeota archaeon]
MEVKLGKYQHFKGNFYEVIGVARHSENPKEEFIVYRALYESKEFGKNTLWIRPKKMFLEIIERDGKKFPRFKFIE